MPRTRPKNTTTSGKRARAQRSPSAVQPRQLPLEMVSEIVSHLDSQRDRPTLAVLLRVSSSLWDIAARRLYRDLELDEERLSRLLDCGIAPKYKAKSWSYSRVQGFRRRGESRLTERTRRALSLVHRLHLEIPLEKELYTRLWDLTVSNMALFPCVRQVVLARDEWPGSVSCTDIKYLPEPDVFLFDSIDLCVQGYLSHRRLPHLPARHCKTVAFHGVQNRTVLDNPFPTNWDQAYIFDPRGINFDRSDNWFWKGFNIYNPESKIPAPDIPVVVCVENDTPEREVLPNVHYYWEPAWAKTLSVAFNDECPVCVVCGKRWERERWEQKYGA